LLKIALTIMIASSALTAVSQDGCLAWNGSQYCSQCDTGNMYYQIGNGCVRYSGNSCTAIDYQGNCINCQQGFYLAYGNTCTLATYIVGCTQYATDTATTICRACAADYILDRNRCLQSVPNCLQYIVGTNICARCALGYTQAPDWCSCVPGTIQNCVQYDCLGLCVLCQDTFPRLSSDRKLCLTWTSYCAVHLPTANGCKICYSGYVLSNDALACFPGIKWCKTYTQVPSSGVLTCSICQTDYILAADFLSCNGAIPNCKTYNNAVKTCTLCEVGYVPTDDFLVCLKVIANCVVYQPSNALSTSLKCLNCFTGYEVSTSQSRCTITCANGQSACNNTNTCAVIPICCEFHDSCGNCLSVKPGWLWCERKYCVAIPTDCPKNYDSCGLCVCPVGQSWCSTQKQCIAIPSCCVNHDGCGNCQSTKVGTTWCAIEKKCYNVPTGCQKYDNCGKCICDNGFLICPATNVCVQEPFCCVGNSDLCGNCIASNLPAYRWCVTTKTCNPVNADCPALDNGCGVCICQAGFAWCAAQKLCIQNVNCPAGATYIGCGQCQCPNNQQYCAQQNQCITILSCWQLPYTCGVPVIKAGFKICATTGACYQVPTCPGGQEVCGVCNCNAPQVWCAAQNKCADIPSCCITHDSCGSCTGATQPNTVFLGGVCYNKVNIPNCLTWTANLQLCQQCVNGYGLNFSGSACLPDILKCQTYVPVAAGDLVRKCQVCLSPYVLSADQTLCQVFRCVIENRAAPNLTCTQCETGLILNDEKNICAEQIQFCLKYNLGNVGGVFFTTCTRCSLPTFVRGGSCAKIKFAMLSTGFGIALGGGASFFAAQTSGSGLTLGWYSYSASFTSSSYFFMFDLDIIEGTTDVFSLRVFRDLYSGSTLVSSTPFSMTCSSSGALTLATYKPVSSSINIADPTQRWQVVYDFVSDAYTIVSQQNFQYLSYNANQTGATAIKFFFVFQ